MLRIGGVGAIGSCISSSYGGVNPYRLELIGSDLGTDLLKWNDGVLADNGKIYGSPYRSTSVLEIDPITETVSTFGTLSSDINKWYNITKANDGLLYCIPNNVTDVLEIDPINRTTNTYAGATSPVATVVKWPEAILASNGNIYGIPNRAQDVLEFNPTTKAINLFGGFTDNVPKWSKPVLGSDGLIYAGPIQSETTILEIDPSTPSATTRATSITGTSSYNDIIFANGKVYLIPFDATGIGIFNITTKAFTTTGNFSGSGKWNHSVIADDGHIYCIPSGGATYVLEIDPSDDSYTTFGNVGDASTILQWNKAVLGNDGKIYAFPALNHNKALVIDPVGKTAKEFGNYTSAATFRWPYNVNATNGKIFGIPLNVDYVAMIDTGVDETPQYIEYANTLVTTPSSTTYSDGTTTVRRRIVSSVYQIEISLTPTGFSGTENVDWEWLVKLTGQDPVFRTGVRDGDFVVDCEITPTGFSGSEGTDWENLTTAPGGGSETTYRDGVRNGSYVIDKELNGTGFSGTEGVDWENVRTYKPV
jgi:hypothetical protein